MSDAVVLIKHAETASGAGLAAYEEIGGKWMVYPTTPCCGASGTGSETSTGVACRACYETVDPLYGDFRIMTKDGPENDDIVSEIGYWIEDDGEGGPHIQEILKALVS